MPAITLELISIGTQQTITLPVHVHVHKRIDRFQYLPRIASSAVPISYLESKPIDSWENIQITNRTYGIPINSPRVLSRRLGWTEVRSVSYASEYKEIAVTHKIATDAQGINRPLFWKHVLPTDTVECEVYTIRNGNKHSLDSGILKSLEDGVIYTNYQNWHDPDTGSYQIFFVVSSISDGTSTHEILNPVPVVAEATWEDIDLDTGELKDGVVVYTREQSSSGYTYYFTSGGPWYIRALDSSIVQPVRPTGKGPKDSWFIKFTNGDFNALTNGRIRRYRLPEYDLQPFFPYKPNVYSPYRSMLRVNKRTLVSTRKNLTIDPDNSLHLTLYVYDLEGVLIKVLTTDQALAGTRYSDTDVLYEGDKILSWDNTGGFVSVGFDLIRGWQYDASYYYRTTELEYTGVTLNPIENPDVLKTMHVFYMVPDVLDSEQALHHLVVDPNGWIVGCSQGDGSSYENLQALDQDGVWNPSTIIGTKYASDEHSDTFLDQYTVGYNNDHAYYVVAEVVVANKTGHHNLIEIDVRRPAGLTESGFAQAIRRNPKILQSTFGYGEDGQEIPQNGVMVLETPITLLEDYGGQFTEDGLRKTLDTYAAMGGYSVVRWVYDASVLTGTSVVTGEVDLEWTWEGPDLTYTLYRADSPEAEWVQIYQVVDPAEATLTYTDSVTSGSTYYYGVRITNQDIELPYGNTLAVRAK